MCRYNHRPFDLITHHVMLVRYSLILPIRLGNSSRFVTSVFIAKCHDEGSVVSGGGVFFFTTGLGLMIIASFCSWTSDEVVFLFRTSGPSRSTTKPRSRKLYIGLACHCAKLSCRFLAGGECVTGVSRGPDGGNRTIVLELRPRMSISCSFSSYVDSSSWTTRSSSNFPCSSSQRNLYRLTS